MVLQYLYCSSMGHKDMVHCKKNFRFCQLQFGRTYSLHMSQQDMALRLIQRHPMRDTVRKCIRHASGIFCKPLRALRIQPASPHLQSLRIVPVKQGNIRLNSGLQQGIHQIAVKSQSFFIDLTGSFRHHARPADGKSKRLDSDLFHQFNVRAISVIKITRNISGIVVNYIGFSVCVLSKIMCMDIPDRRSLSILLSCALNLIGCGSRTPDKILRKHFIVLSSQSPPLPQRRTLLYIRFL